jgi:hypothetical protein
MRQTRFSPSITAARTPSVSPRDSRNQLWRTFREALTAAWDAPNRFRIITPSMLPQHSWPEIKPFAMRPVQEYYKG